MGTSQTVPNHSSEHFKRSIINAQPLTDNAGNTGGVERSLFTLEKIVQDDRAHVGAHKTGS